MSGNPDKSFDHASPSPHVINKSLAIVGLGTSKAGEALEFSTQSINEIAWKVGYEDQGAFRKIFNRIVGLPPGEYRKRFGIADRPRVDCGIRGG